MKRYPDYKKLFSGIFLFTLLIVPLAFSHAETAEEVRNKINQKSADIAELEKQIKAYQSELDSLGKQKNSLSTSLQELDITRKKLNADISITQNKIDKTNLQIENLSGDIGDKETSIRTDTSSIKSGIKDLSEIEEASFVEKMLANDDFSVMWTDVDNIMTVRETLRDNIARLRETKVVLEDTRDKTIAAKNELTRLKTQLGDQQKIVIQNTNEKNKLLSQTKNSEANYQKLVADQIAKKAAFEKELRDYESQLQFILDPSKLPKAGVLSWPLSEIYVTQEFGAKTGPHRTYVNGHSGTDFRARTPLPAFAMADGIVMGTGNTDLACPGASFGQWILIKYDNGLASTYGHLSLIKVVKGQKVSRGQVVAYTGSTGRVTGPHLHVSLYVASAVKVETLPSIACPNHILTQPIAPINAYLDPMYYLPPYK
jgi:murein DD-endopeptidase MepM/ murein hydrolase activator NlpD